MVLWYATFFSLILSRQQADTLPEGESGSLKNAMLTLSPIVESKMLEKCNADTLSDWGKLKFEKCNADTLSDCGKRKLIFLGKEKRFL